jgi:hypothetical protein
MGASPVNVHRKGGILSGLSFWLVNQWHRSLLWLMGYKTIW